MEKTNMKRNLFIAGGILIVLIIAIIVIAVNIHNKPNKNKAKELVENYVVAMSEGSGEKMLNCINPQGYIIYKQDGEKKFDENYKKKDDFINNYLNNNDISDLDLATQKISSEFENTYGYYTYTVNEISSIENSQRSKNLIIVRCKIQLKSSRYSAVNSAKIYILKNNGDYKIVGMEM